MSLMISLALLCGLALASAGLSFFVLYRARSLVSSAEHRARTGQARFEAAMQVLQTAVDGLSTQLQDIRQTPPAGVPALPKPGLNLSKRSQALRMHRRGDPPDQIAATLEIPVQELDLLLKIHRIVMTSI